jgi:hypothetical protein
MIQVFESVTLWLGRSCSWGNFITHPLAGFSETFYQRVIGFLRTGLDAVPGGFSGVRVIGQLLVQLRRLIAQRLELGLGLSLDGVTGVVNFCGKCDQILI